MVVVNWILKVNAKEVGKMEAWNLVEALLLSLIILRLALAPPETLNDIYSIPFDDDCGYSLMYKIS
ncbi:6704_t:CDS:2 [Gigaspora margarita]|uniref:6704_t:CDS:1 n=1 Tax=Gigaspora margarita TaxID=4874 RepID=A0ABN7UJX6_GIGMA|nr:6704_t:CDS:2 [Gigaspora margarita]